MKKAAMVLGVWTLLGLLFALQVRVDAMYSGHPISAAQALILSLTGWYGWALLSPFVIWLARRVGIAWHVLIGLVVTFVKIALTTEILRRAGMSPQTLIINVPLNLLTYAGIVAATHAIDSRSLLAEARLELLKTQLEPHFLFNTLHSIAELMHQDVDAADRMLTRLSELLRATLESGSQQEVRFADELALVERYLDIERVRFEDRLHVRFDVEEAALDGRVPAFALQPLVENAIRHGGGAVVLKARRERDQLFVGVDDDGAGFKEGSVERIGLRNTRARLAQLYDGRQQLTIGRGALGGASVSIVLPFRT